jgi:hypothetical protein
MKKRCLRKNPSLSLLLIFFLISILSLSPKSTFAEGVAVASFSRNYLPLIVTPGSPPGPTTRLVIFEEFLNPL